MLKRILLLLVSCALTIGLVEIVLRTLVSPDALPPPVQFSRAGAWVVTDPVLGWRNEPGYRSPPLSINSHGLRGPEVRMDDDGLTVACLGDSGTFGLWIDETNGKPVVRFDGYPTELRRFGRRQGISQVLNAGVVGYTSANGLRQLVMQLAALRPSIVTVRFGVNDHRATGNPSRRISEPAWRRRFYALCSSPLVRIGLGLYRSVPAFHPPPWTRPWVEPDEFRHNLTRIAEEARRVHAKVLFIDTPLRPLEMGQERVPDNIILHAGYKTQAEFYAAHERYQAILARVAAANGVPFLRTRAALGDTRVRHFSERDFVHPNAEGARVIADLLLEELDRLGWLDR